MILLLSQLAWANCSLEALDAELQAARLAAVDGRFDRRRRRVILDQLGCTNEPVDPARLAEVHTVLGLYEQQRGDLDLAARHILAAWEAAPLVPPAIDLDDELTQASVTLQEQHFLAPRAITPVASAPVRRVDGLPATWHTTGLPALVQPDGLGVQLVSPARSSVAAASKSGPKMPLLIAGIASGVVAGGLYGGAWAARGQYDNALETGAGDDARRSAHSLNRGLSVASVGALGLGGVLVGLSF